MTSGGPAGKPARQHAAGPAAPPGIDGPAEDATDGAETSPPDDVQELQEEIEQTREQLGETVEQLAAKADVKARARDKAAALTGRVKGKTSQARAQAAASAGKAKEQLSGRVVAVGTPVWQATPEPVRQAVAKGASSARQRRAPLAVAAGVLVVGFLAVRWWRRR